MPTVTMVRGKRAINRSRLFAFTITFLLGTSGALAVSVSSESHNVPSDNDSNYYRRALGNMVSKTLSLSVQESSPASQAPDIAQNSRRDVDAILENAEHAYTAGQKKKALALFAQAAEQHSGEASYALATKFDLEPQQAFEHYLDAARLGHEKALEIVLDRLFYNAESEQASDPAMALRIVQSALRFNPDAISASKTSILSRCAEAGKFSLPAFLSKYGLTQLYEESRGLEYFVWELAEEASRGGRFLREDDRLTLQLVCRGGWAIAETEDAVETVHAQWKAGTQKPFNICDHITSGYGAGYCAMRMEQAAEKERFARLEQLKPHFSSENFIYLQQIYDVAKTFIETKAETEEFHAGSGRNAWVQASTTNQLDAFIGLINLVVEKQVPIPTTDYKSADKALNKIYQTVIDKLRKQPYEAFNLRVTAEDVRKVQRQWIGYRDQLSRFLHTINPDVSIEQWGTLLTQARSAQLDRLNDYME
ncbi:lysozyme inhibitor LprI family protein [Kistimonas asteriae]|uniref:lysozyme inhibitor LprI family protein n=1 Tax=Kistimonas asteriae TaxID=517724 RepID=UPI001BA7AF4B|nr:lysozyme inhibitor LprI family protein [Kistimonas asteriae]